MTAPTQERPISTVGPFSSRENVSSQQHLLQARSAGFVLPIFDTDPDAKSEMTLLQDEPSAYAP
jgi:hypothetical protein